MQQHPGTGRWATGVSTALALLPSICGSSSTRAANLALTCSCQELSSALNLTLISMSCSLAGRGVLWDGLHQSLCASISLQSESSIRPPTTRGNRWQFCPPADHKSSYSEDTVHITPKQEIYQVILINSPPLKHLSADWRGDTLLQGSAVCSTPGAEHPKNTYGGSLLPLLDCTDISLHYFPLFLLFLIFPHLLQLQTKPANLQMPLTQAWGKWGQAEQGQSNQDTQSSAEATPREMLALLRLQNKCVWMLHWQYRERKPLGKKSLMETEGMGNCHGNTERRSRAGINPGYRSAGSF